MYYTSNAIRIFNEKEADELIVLDIDATTKGLNPDFSIIKKLVAYPLVINLEFF